MHFATPFSFLTLLLSAEALNGPPLYDALAQAGAGAFANRIKASTYLSEIFNSPDIGTIFAPMDSVVAARSLPCENNCKRQSSEEEEQEALAAAMGQSNLGAAGVKPGVAFKTPLKPPGLGGNSQVVVSDSRNTNNTNHKRWVFARHNNVTTPPPSLLRLTCGLGSVVNVIKGDIPYSNGYIHLTDNFLTVPQSVSASTKAIGLNTFNKLANGSNLTSSLDNTPVTTVFLPSDAAFAAANISTSSAATAGMLGGHILPNFLGYLPELKNGQTLVTQTGKTLTVTIDGQSNYYINNAKITQANIILPNGVAHVVDKVIEPNPPAVTSGSDALTNSMSTAGAIKIVCALIGAVLIGMA